VGYTSELDATALVFTILHPATAVMDIVDWLIVGDLDLPDANRDLPDADRSA